MEQLLATLRGAHEHSLLARQDVTGDNASETAGTLFCPTPVNITGPSCAGVSNALLVVIIILIIVAVAAVIILSFIQRRVKLCPNVCWGYPGIATPVNLLGATRFRYIYAVIFGLMTYEFFYAVLSGGVPTFWTPPDSKLANAVLSTFSRLIYVLILTFLYYPLLATVDSTIPLVGLAVGAVYSTVWFAYTLTTLAQDYIGCNSGCARNPLEFIILLVLQLPLVLSYLGVILWFIIRLVQEIYRLIKSPKPFSVKLREKPAQITYHENRVRVLLKGARAQKNKTTRQKLLSKVYPYDKNFQFPLRFLIAMTATFFIVLVMTTRLLLLVVTFSAACGVGSALISDFYSGVNVTEIEDATGFPEEFLDVIVGTVTSFLLGLAVVVPIVSLVVLGFIYIMMFLMYRSVNQSIRSASQGDYSFLTLKKPPLYRSLDASIKYIGYQVAYFIWALFLYMAIAAGGGIVFVLGAVLLILVPAIILEYILPLVISFVWSQVIFWGQILFCWLFFTKKDGDAVYVHNRRLYNWVAYILLFQNAFVGFFSAILRFLKSALFGSIIVTRLDRVLYMKGFERFDSAYKTFVGFLVLDLSLNNSVMHVFCKLLLEKRKLCTSESSLPSDSEPGKGLLLEKGTPSPVSGKEYESRHSLRARNRWMKAYTLLRNPSLIETTAKKLEEKKLQTSLAFTTNTIVEVVSL